LSLQKVNSKKKQNYRRNGSKETKITTLNYFKGLFGSINGRGGRGGRGRILMRGRRREERSFNLIIYMFGSKKGRGGKGF
jgi:hypothetical protein